MLAQGQVNRVLEPAPAHPQQPLRDEHRAAKSIQIHFHAHEDAPVPSRSVVAR